MSISRIFVPDMSDIIRHTLPDIPDNPDFLAGYRIIRNCRIFGPTLFISMYVYN